MVRLEVSDWGQAEIYTSVNLKYANYQWTYDPVWSPSKIKSVVKPQFSPEKSVLLCYYVNPTIFQLIWN